MITRDPDLPIGVFDSGVGGLTVARAIRAVLPSEAILYLGDTARVPYGNRGADTIRRYVLGAARTLTHHDIKALVVACNTATAYGMEALRETFPDLPIIGVVTPVAKAAAARTESGYIGVIGTRGTVRSRCYVDALNACDTDLRITQLPCPLFVPLAEEGWTSGDVPFEVARTYLSELQGSDLDTLILGCTHYPLLRDTISIVLDTLMDRYVTTLDSAQSTAQALKELLTEQDLLTTHSAHGDLRFLVTDEPKGFMGTAFRFFGGPIPDAEHIDIIMEETS